MPVVDLLEAVEVEEQHGHEFPGPPLAADALEPLVEAARVGEAGQRVVRGLVRELVLQHFQLLVHLRVAQRRAGLGRAQLESFALRRGRRAGVRPAGREHHHAGLGDRHRHRHEDGVVGRGFVLRQQPAVRDRVRRRRPHHRSAGVARAGRGADARVSGRDAEHPPRVPNRAGDEPAARHHLDLEHRRVGETHLTDGGAQRVEHLVHVETRALAATERRRAEQRVPALGFVALAAVGRDLFDQMRGEHPTRHRDEEHDREPLRDLDDRRARRGSGRSSRCSRPRSRPRSRARRRPGSGWRPPAREA